MERKLASIQRIKRLEPIEGADAIEKATILGWNVVVKKGEFKEGDLCIYCEIDSLLPLDNAAWQFLSKGNSPKRTVIDGKEYVGYRLKTVRLRGQISQGLALPLTVLSREDDLKEGADVTAKLCIVKYEPPMPANLAGIVKGLRPSFVPKTDEMRIQAVPYILERYKDLKFVITEKLDGSSVSIYFKDGGFGVCSRNLELVRDEANTMWKIVIDSGLENKMREYSKNLVLQGEIVGEGVQKNTLKLKGQKIYFYNAYEPNTDKYLNTMQLKEIADSLGLQTVPVFDSNFTLPDTVDEFVGIVSKLKSLISPEVQPEGVVVRPVEEQRDPDLGRLSFKVINPEYLIANNE